MNSATMKHFALLLPLALAAAPDWVAHSDELANAYVELWGEFSPETNSYYGLGHYDSQVRDFSPDAPTRYRAALTGLKEHYHTLLATEENPFVREDLQIFINNIDDEITGSALTEEYLLPFTNLPRSIYFGIFSLLKPDGDASRREFAPERLRRYLGLTEATVSALDQVKQTYTMALADNPDRLAPFRDSVEQNLADAPRLAAGIRALFDSEEFDQTELAPVLEILDAQIADFVAWVEETILPTARDDARLPAPLYAQNLRNVGLDITPQQSIERGQIAFSEIRNEMQVIAQLVAAERGWPETDYRDVCRRLKQEQIPADEVLADYEAVIAQVEDIIRRERIVTLPDRPMAIRLATAAENAAQPAPHMQAPPMRGGTGEERGTFVLTTGTPPKEGETSDTYDDFTFAAAMWTLTAHEGRPGHELQFAAMIERGVSLARSIFAANSVNIEGWALYAEAELKPYEPLEGQLVALQYRLLRAARAFLDPMLNLGLITRAEAERVLREDVVQSDAMVKQECDRYTFRSPGQATSYFYGYQRLMQLRAETEVALGDKFDRLAFNDFILEQGAMPPNLVADAVRRDFIPNTLATE